MNSILDVVLEAVKPPRKVEWDEYPTGSIAAFKVNDHRFVLRFYRSTLSVTIVSLDPSDPIEAMEGVMTAPKAVAGIFQAICRYQNINPDAQLTSPDPLLVELIRRSHPLDQDK